MEGARRPRPARFDLIEPAVGPTRGGRVPVPGARALTGERNDGEGQFDVDGAIMRELRDESP